MELKGGFAAPRWAQLCYNALMKSRRPIMRDLLNSRARRQAILFAIALGLAVVVILWRLIANFF
jgi:hypothetical protein